MSTLTVDCPELERCGFTHTADELPERYLVYLAGYGLDAVRCPECGRYHWCERIAPHELVDAADRRLQEFHKTGARQICDVHYSWLAQDDAPEDRAIMVHMLECDRCLALATWCFFLHLTATRFDKIRTQENPFGTFGTRTLQVVQ